MAIIKDHLNFIRAILAFATSDDTDVADVILGDCRDKMTEPDYYGLVALEAAEKFFETMPPLEMGDFLAIIRKPEGQVLLVPAAYEGNELIIFLAKSVPKPFEDTDWDLIAMQDPERI